jgi:hypothetical protein
MLPNALVGIAANRFAKDAVSSMSISSRTTRLTSPIRYASSASTAPPSMLISIAFPSPTMRGKKYVTPASGMSPILTKATENVALSAASRMSQARAIPTPAP